MKDLWKRLARQLPGVRALDAYLRGRYLGLERPEPFPRGHYYSPLPDCQDVVTRAAELFVKDVDLGPSIRLRAAEQLVLLQELAAYYPDFDWPEQPRPGYRYHAPNGWFDEGDAIVLHGLLRHLRPRRVLEAGSGFSSALMLDTNDRFLGQAVRFTFVDPEPQRLRSLLRPADEKYAQVIADVVQKVPLATFAELEANDILFIDSSHAAKVGSDVTFFFFDVLPRLQPGVVVHVHDILWPFEYPQEWFLEGRAWNEVYLLRAFLQYNEMFEILLFNSYMGYKHAALLENLMPRFLKNTGGSIWLRKRG